MAGTQPVRVRVRVRLFAIQRELVGARDVPLELAAGATIDDAWEALIDRYPALAPGRASVRFARNTDYAAADTILADGDELAIIPPVSGGSGADDPGDADGPGADAGGDSDDGPIAGIVEIREDPFDAGILAELIARLATPADGAVVAFLGITRESPGTPAPGQEAEAARHAGRDVEALEYEVHPVMALRVMAEIADEIEVRFRVTRLALVHRSGVVPLGAASVAIVACAPHRDDAFAAARYAIDETKARAPIWKAERFADGHVWIGAPAREGPAEG